jgi:hypothetical protein
VVNWLSWLILLSGAVALIGLLVPGRPRRWLWDHPWEIALAVWTLIPSAVLAGALVAGPASPLAADGQLVAALPALATIPILHEVRLSPLTLALVALPIMLAAAVFPPLLLLPAAVGVLGATHLFLTGRKQTSKRCLMILIVLVNASSWLALIGRAIGSQSY